MHGSVDRSVALGQVQGEGLALLNVPQVRKTKVRLLLPEVIQVPKFINDATVEIEYQPYRITSGIIHLGSSVLHGHYVAFAIRPEGIWLMDDNRKGQWIPQFTVQQLSNIYMLWATPLTTPSGGP